MAYNTPETVADYLARFQMEITHRGKGTFTPDHVKYSLTIVLRRDEAVCRHPRLQLLQGDLRLDA